MAEIRSVNELLKMNLNIPDYQRPYKWDIQNIEDLFLDITNAISDADRYRTDFKYRIGTIILHQTEDIMDTELTPTQMAIEFLRRDTTVMTPAQYLKKLKLLELEFADLMALSSLELKEEIDLAWRLGIH